MACDFDAVTVLEMHHFGLDFFIDFEHAGIICQFSYRRIFHTTYDCVAGSREGCAGKSHND